MNESGEEHDAARERVVRHSLAEPESCNRDEKVKSAATHVAPSVAWIALTAERLHPHPLDVVHAQREQDRDHHAEPPARAVAPAKLVDQELDAFADVDHSYICRVREVQEQASVGVSRADRSGQEGAQLT